ncbi:protein kinase-like domain, Phloem protein 2-like protein [Artemisia annua]|uniref:Protein kinase-like domain, Phloem protein 2-like protein n=1 Tax=Artemisia annua TaxID=35608 RepID=A0A2U1NWQ7_ARTAN|nr:protein kinase-like domain, Phloem protein 2-like protein [Artemisia annua]
MVAFKRLDRKFGQGDPEFWKEIMMLSRYTHENLISLLGYCNEGGEMILVYEHVSKDSLDRHLSSTTLTHSLKRVLHRDIKIPNILLDENWNAKVSDMGLSKLGPANQQHTALMTNAVGTPGYYDPLYMELGYLTKESDVYSFGVVLLEVLFGKLCYEYINGQYQLLVRMWKKGYEENNIDQFIFHYLKQQMDSSSLKSFSDIASECLKRSRDERPPMADVEIYEKVKLPTDYKEIIKTAVPTLNYGSEVLKKILLKGTLLNSGKSGLQLT